MKNGGHIPCDAIAICEMSKTPWQMGGHFYERRFGEPLKGLVIPFGAMVEYHPISARDKSRLHQFCKKVLPGIFLGYALTEVEYGKETFRLQTLKSWKFWTSQKSVLEGSTQKK